MRPEAVIVVDDLVKRFGDFTAVNHISFTVARGEIFGFLGPNGAGKTTTIRMLLGLLQPTSGQVSVLGRDVSSEHKAMQARVGYMSQAFTLYPDLTAEENLSFYGQVYGLRAQELQRRKWAALEMAGLVGHERELTVRLSGGWRQRLALGCAIVHSPELVFLDEPTAGVDPVSRRSFWQLIYDLVRQGTTVFVTTHYMDAAEHCQRVGFIADGALLEMGSPDELKAKRMRGQVLEVVSADAEGTVRALRQAHAAGMLELDEVALYGAQVHVVSPNADQSKVLIASALADAGIALSSMQRVAPSLEDVFISSVRQTEQDLTPECGSEAAVDER